MSLYDFVNEQYRKANPIMVCHVTEEEYKLLSKSVKADDYTEDNLKEFRTLFSKTLDKCDKSF